MTSSHLGMTESGYGVLPLKIGTLDLPLTAARDFLGFLYHASSSPEPEVGGAPGNCITSLIVCYVIAQ